MEMEKINIEIERGNGKNNRNTDKTIVVKLLN